MRSTIKLTLILLSLGSAQALTPGVATPQGGWMSWRCVKFDACQIIRMNPAGEVVAASDEANTGVSKGDLILSLDGSTLYTVGQHLTALEAVSLKTRWRVDEVKSVTPLAVSPDGQTLALGSDPAGRIEFRRSGDGIRLSSITHPGPALAPDNWEAYYRTVTALAYSPDGRTLAIGSLGGGIRLRDLGTGRERRLSGGCGQNIPAAHRGVIHDLRWTDDTTLLSAANDGTMRRWNVGLGRPTGCLSLPGGPQTVVGLPGNQLAAVASTWVYLIDPLTFRVRATAGPHAGPVSGVALRGTELETRDAVSQRRWNLMSGRQVSVTGKVLASLNEGGVQITVGPDMRVSVGRGAAARQLAPVAALPYGNDRFSQPAGWSIQIQGGQLRVAATSTVRFLVMETTEFTNTFSWSLNTGVFEGCVTGGPNGTGPAAEKNDPACPRIASP